MKMKEIEEMLEYNINKGANDHTINRLRKELEEARNEFKRKVKDWYKCYMDDQRRGEGGGSQENAEAILFPMNDNRVQSTKMTQSEREAYYEALKEFEEEHGKLPRLSRRV